MFFRVVPAFSFIIIDFPCLWLPTCSLISSTDLDDNVWNALNKESAEFTYLLIASDHMLQY